jgi:hypothetical protein
MGTPDSPMVHRTITVHRPVCATSARQLTRSDRCSAGSPDSPVNYSGARLAETREWPIRLRSGLVHRTLSGTPKAILMSFAPNLFVSPTEFLSWFVLNLMHLR